MSKMTFQQLPLTPPVLQAVEDMNYDHTTKIQAAAIPPMLEGKDIIGLSGTGTGKTAAFAIPAVERIDGELSAVQVLILCPTRELAMQISGEVQKFAKYKKEVHVATIYGGQPFDTQFRQLKTANIVVGTPGRVMDHMERRTLRLEQVRTVILDEADEMLNMGFLEDIQTILKDIPSQHQTVLFSATMSDEILKITEEFQTDPLLLQINKDQRSIDHITQYFYEVPQARKMDVVNLLLQMYQPKRTVIFTNTKSMVEELVSYLNEHGFKSQGLHGDMKQMSRTRVMNNYKSGKVQILVATDVAARGIDVEDIEAVINFDIPQEYEYYIHRIGRTARAGKTGTAYTLVCNTLQRRKLRDIEKYVGTTIESAPIPTPDDILRRDKEELIQRIVDELDKENAGSDHYIMEQLLSMGYDSWKVSNVLVSMLAGKKRKNIPMVKPIVTDTKKATPAEGKTILRASIGRSQRIAPNFIVGAIVEGTGIPASSIGKIDIFNDYTMIELSHEDAQKVLDEMEGGKIKGIPVHYIIGAKGKAQKSKEKHSFSPRSKRESKSSRPRRKETSRFGGKKKHR